MGRAALALTATFAALAGCGGPDDAPETRLEWADEPTLIRAPTAGADRVLIGELRNESDEHVELLAERIVVRDADDQRLRADGRYVASYLHGLYGADVPTKELPQSERLRLGLTAVLGPSDTTPVYAAFRARDAYPPLELTTGEDSLLIPPGLNEARALL